MKAIIKILKAKQADAAKDVRWTEKKVQKNPKHIGYLIEWNNSLTSLSIYSEIISMLEKK